MEYEKGTPTKRGVYAVRIPHDNFPGLCQDEFLIWIDNKWGYLSSDQNYRGEVVAFIGPLPRIHK